MKRFRLFKATSLVLLTWFVAGIAADELRTRIRKRYQDRYQRDVADFRAQAESYRRPMLFGEAIDGNAAVWYQQSFAHVRTISGSQLGDAVRAGSRDYAKTATAAIKDVCAEAESRRVADALRCTHCNWALSTDGVTSLEHHKEAMVLGQCLTVLGHREAHRRDRRAAVRAYLAGLAVGCDLGRGDLVMTLVGMISAEVALKAIAELVVSMDDDRVLLSEVSSQLSKFAGSLPTGKPSLLYDRLWLDKISLDRLNSWRTLTRWQLSPARTLLDQMAELASDVQTSDRSARVDELGKRVTANHDEVAETMRLERDVALLTVVSRLMRLFHAVQTVMALQAWHIEHHRYPPTAEATGERLDRFGIRYEVTENGDGFKLIDLHPSKPEIAVVFEHPPRHPEN